MCGGCASGVPTALFQVWRSRWSVQLSTVGPGSRDLRPRWSGGRDGPSRVVAGAGSRAMVGQVQHGFFMHTAIQGSRSLSKPLAMKPRWLRYPCQARIFGITPAPVNTRPFGTARQRSTSASLTSCTAIWSKRTSRPGCARHRAMHQGTKRGVTRSPSPNTPRDRLARARLMRDD